MNEQQNSTDPLREEFETAISELTPDERAELLEQYKAKKAQSRVVKENGRVNKRTISETKCADRFFPSVRTNYSLQPLSC